MKSSPKEEWSISYVAYQQLKRFFKALIQHITCCTEQVCKVVCSSYFSIRSTWLNTEPHGITVPWSNETTKRKTINAETFGIYYYYILFITKRK